MSTTEKPSVVEALAAVMGDVQAIRKGDRNTQQNYNFRGIDAVVNAVGPALRTHGVVALPISVSCESEHYTTARGAPMHGVILTVGFRFYGPAGDFLDAMTCGQASDAGDKAVPKAHSVAFRTLLLQALCIPTDEPDPDSQSHERAADISQDSGPGEQRLADSAPPGASSPPEPDASSGGASAPGPEALAERLITIAAQLGAEDATREAIGRNRAIGDPAGHIAWLERCIVTGEQNLAESARGKDAQASIFQAPTGKRGAGGAGQ